MAITTTQELQDAVTNALDGAGLNTGAVNDALMNADLEVIPTVYDDRYWRLLVDGVEEERVLDSEDLPRELALVLNAQPTAVVAVRPADEEETHAYMLLGEGGLRDLDERRRAMDSAMAEETAAALTAALGGGA